MRWLCRGGVFYFFISITQFTDLTQLYMYRSVYEASFAFVHKVLFNDMFFIAFPISCSTHRCRFLDRHPVLQRKTHQVRSSRVSRRSVCGCGFNDTDRFHCTVCVMTCSLLAQLFATAWRSRTGWSPSRRGHPLTHTVLPPESGAHKERSTPLPRDAGYSSFPSLYQCNAHKRQAAPAL